MVSDCHRPRTAAGIPATYDGSGVHSGPHNLSLAIGAAQLGDEAAFRVLYREMQPRLLRYLTARIGADAEDVASECWLRVARDIGTFRGDVDDFWVWTVTIARYRAIDHLRRRDRLPLADVRIEDLLDMPGPEDPATLTLDRISTENTISLIGTLPRDQAEAVLLRVVFGFEPVKVARILGKRPGAVRTASYRGLRALARRMKPRSPAERSGSTR